MNTKTRIAQIRGDEEENVLLSSSSKGQWQVEKLDHIGASPQE